MNSFTVLFPIHFHIMAERFIIYWFYVPKSHSCNRMCIHIAIRVPYTCNCMELNGAFHGKSLIVLEEFSLLVRVLYVYGLNILLLRWTCICEHEVVDAICPWYYEFSYWVRLVYLTGLYENSAEMEMLFFRFL